MQRYGLSIDSVIVRFIHGHDGGTAAADVPGGRRVESKRTVFDNRTHDLYSYRTVQAVRLNDGRIAVTTKKYSRTTTKMVNRLLTRLAIAGYEITGTTIDVQAAVPGRWNGFGLAWHPTGYETLPFVVYHKPA